MEIDEVSDILNSFGLLAALAPEHIFVTDEPISEQLNGAVKFKGLSPVKKRSVMILSRDADSSTVPHEWAHSALGVGEKIAYPLGNLMKIRYELKRRLPIKRRRALLRAQYEEGEVPEEYKGRVKHYVLVR